MSLEQRLDMGANEVLTGIIVAFREASRLNRSMQYDCLEFYIAKHYALKLDWSVGQEQPHPDLREETRYLGLVAAEREKGRMHEGFNLLMLGSMVGMAATITNPLFIAGPVAIGAGAYGARVYFDRRAQERMVRQVNEAANLPDEYWCAALKLMRGKT